MRPHSGVLDSLHRVSYATSTYRDEAVSVMLHYNSPDWPRERDAAELLVWRRKRGVTDAAPDRRP
jgi:hypothetical protein